MNGTVPSSLLEMPSARSNGERIHVATGYLPAVRRQLQEQGSRSTANVKRVAARPIPFPLKDLSKKVRVFSWWVDAYRHDEAVRPA